MQGKGNGRAGPQPKNFPLPACSRQAGRRTGLPWFTVLTAALGLLPGPAYAALRAPPRVGLEVAGGWAGQSEVRISGQLDAGLTHGLGLRILAGPALAGKQLQGRILAGPTWSLDALSYVPRVGVLVGLELPRGLATVQAGGEVSRYVSLHTAVFVGGWGVWRQDAQFGGLVSVGLQREL